METITEKPKVTFPTTKDDKRLWEILKERVDEYFSSNKITRQGNNKLYIKTVTLFITELLLYCLLVFTDLPYFVKTFLCLLLGVNTAAIGFNIMHDASHGSYSKRKWVNTLMSYSLNLVGGSAYLWKLKHVAAHHHYTNVKGYDDDIEIKPFIRIDDTDPKFWFNRYQHKWWYWSFFYSFTYFFWIFFQDFKKYFTKRIAKQKFKMDIKEHFIFWITKLVYVYIFLIVPAQQVGIIPALIGFTIFDLVCGEMIATIFQLAHIVPLTKFPKPNDNGEIHGGQMRHQLATTADFGVNSNLLFLLLGGLNFQVEHHLFPKISHVHYPAIRKIVVEFCEEFKINHYEYPTLFVALRNHVMFLKSKGK